ncbi:MAG TPA: hypothetical protein VI757_03400 [Bacteroidia bacterium]|nr:hypothetical protein [Bacteroidia bacterium]
MTYSIHNLHHKPHDLDDDFLYFYFDIHFSEPEELLVKNYFLPLDWLLPWLEKEHPGFHKYYKDTRTGLEVWGTAEILTVEAMGEEAVQQLYAFAEEYLLACDWVQGLFTREKENRSKTPEEQRKQQQQAKKVYEELSSFGPAMKRSRSRYYRFCEAVEKRIRQMALEVYPEIANLEPAQLKEFRYLFVRDIQSMQSKLEKLVRENPSAKKDS